MTNAELIQKIRAEIERLYDEANNYDDSRHYLGEVLSFLDTLESEKPMEQDDELNDEIKRFVAEYGYERGNDILLIAIVARHFAEWGYLRAADKYNEIEYNRQRAEESVPNDLEEAAKEYAKLDEEGKWKDGGKYKGFLAGSEWMKEQMLKEAVEASVNYYENIPGGSYVELVVDIPNPTGLRYKDKVKIVIVPIKED